jgi:hypothetical protein
VTTPPPSSRWRRLRPRGRGGMIAVVVVAVLAVGVVAAALIGPGRGDRVPGISRAAETGQMESHRGDGDRGPRGFGRSNSPVLVGTVVSTAAGTITITPDGAAARTLITNDDTRVRGNGNSAVGDLQAGERVIVRVSGTGTAATAESIEVPKASVTGTVTALSGDTATVTAVDGLVVSVNVAALSQKPAVGDVVVLTGTVANGTTITADGIRVLPKAA